MTIPSTTSIEHYAYLFEAHSIQRYVIQGGKLAEMVGASELLERLTGAAGPLDDALRQLRYKQGEDYQFSRRGGGAFFILFTDRTKADALRDLWSLITPMLAPGLEWNHAIGQGDNPQQAIADGKKQLSEKRSHPVALLPEANPLIRRNPRTNFPATAMIGDKEGKPISMDKATLAKLGYNRKGKPKNLAKKHKNSLLFNKFIVDEVLKKDWVFPLNLEHSEKKRVFPYRGDDHTIAIIHADGNGLGQILLNLADSLEGNTNYAEIFYELSQKIDQATQIAAQQALEKMVVRIKHNNLISLNEHDKSILPLRPLVLGGDDLTLIIRGDLALDYAEDFLVAFEASTREQLKALHEQHPAIPAQMTACAGIAFIRSNQPFYLGYQLAESLCSHAKFVSKATKIATQKEKSKKRIPSSLAFYHVTTSMIDQYGVVQERELTVQLNGQSHLLSLGAYGMGAFAEELPPFASLRRLKEGFQRNEMARGSIRHLLTLLFANTGDAKIAYRRWREITQDRDPTILCLFDQVATDFFAEDYNVDELPFAPFSNSANAANADSTKKEYRSFLNDLVSWLALEGDD